jgi:hypothetical protein
VVYALRDLLEDAAGMSLAPSLSRPSAFGVVEDLFEDLIRQDKTTGVMLHKTLLDQCAFTAVEEEV